MPRKRRRRSLGQKIEPAQVESFSRDLTSWCRTEHKDPEAKKVETRACIIGATLTVGLFKGTPKIPPPVRMTISDKADEALKACQLAFQKENGSVYRACDQGVSQAHRTIQAEVDRQAIEERERQLVRRKPSEKIGRIRLYD